MFVAIFERSPIRLRPGEDLSIGDKLEVWTRQSAFRLRHGWIFDKMRPIVATTGH